MIHTTQEYRIGDNLKLMRELPDESIDTVITSPPYWSLRDYGVAGQIGLEPTLDEYHTTGWTSCNCNAGWIAGTVLDPFCGSGTVLEVCRLLNRNAIGFDLNPEYEPLIRERSMTHTPPLTSYFGE